MPDVGDGDHLAVRQRFDHAAGLTLRKHVAGAAPHKQYRQIEQKYPDSLATLKSER